MAENIFAVIGCVNPIKSQKEKISFWDSLLDIRHYFVVVVKFIDDV